MKRSTITGARVEVLINILNTIMLSAEIQHKIFVTRVKCDWEKNVLKFTILSNSVLCNFKINNLSNAYCEIYEILKAFNILDLELLEEK